MKMDRISGPSSIAEEAPLLKPKLGDASDTSISRLMQMTVFSFPISLIWATMGMVIMPAEALRLHPTNEAMCLGFMMTVVACSQLVCPLVGQMSDRHSSRFGKRRPYILGGTLMTMVFAAGLWLSSYHRIPELYFLCLFLSQIGLNIVYTAQASLVPDNIKEEVGSISGIVAVWQLAGNFAGMIFIIATHQYDFHYAYAAHLVLLALAAVLVCGIPERPSNDTYQEPVTWKELLQSFNFNIGDDTDFFFVFVGRTLFYISMSCQSFSFFYFRDMLHVTDENDIRKKLAILMLCGTFLAMLTAYPLGKLSDHPRVGRKPLIYFACAAMASVYIGYCTVPLLFSPGQNAELAVYGLGCLYGLGIAGYSSVDYALALDCLPEKQKGSSEALGLWGIAGFVGSSMGPFVGGAILQSHVSIAGGYTYNGYVIMMSMGIVCFIGCGLVTSLIRKVD